MNDFGNFDAKPVQEKNNNKHVQRTYSLQDKKLTSNNLADKQKDKDCNIF